MIDSFGLILANSSCVAETVNNLEIELLKYDQVECSVYHHFSPGLYIREVHIPAGTLAIGHRQRYKHLNIFLNGSVTMINDDGSTSVLKAPMIFTGEPGRKCGYAHEDIVWLNIYPTKSRDIEMLEATYLDKSIDWTESQKTNVQRIADIEDYKKLLSEYGFTEDIAWSQSNNHDDQIDFNDGTYNVAVFDSDIHGKGLFATAPVKAGDYICPARIDGFRTPAGRYSNHSMDPNAEFKLQNGDFILYAIKDIKGCFGGQKGDEITVNYRKSFELQGLKPCQQ